MVGVEIRRAVVDDLAAIARIQVGCPEAPVWPPESYLDYDCSLGLLSALVAGFIVTREVAPLEREILNLATDPVHRRRGIGRALVETEIASAPKGTTWFLEVRESNIAATSLYKAIGFIPAGRREDYYHDPAEAAIVMRFFS
jgi:[ribosomal protein S18]-alanine N-acetyltransferase